MTAKLCPECCSTDTVEIVYGLPTRDTEGRAMRGEIELGGCMVTGDDPDRHCQACGAEWNGSRRRFPL